MGRGVVHHGLGRGMPWKREPRTHSRGKVPLLGRVRGGGAGNHGRLLVPVCMGSQRVWGSSGIGYRW